MTQNCSVVREEIQDVVRRYLKQIKDREDLLLNQVNTFLQAETKSMQHMQDNIDEEIKTLNTAVEEAQKLLDPESNTSIDDVMGELSTFKEQFSKSVDFLKSFTRTPKISPKASSSYEVLPKEIYFISPSWLSENFMSAPSTLTGLYWKLYDVTCFIQTSHFSLKRRQ